MDDLENELFSSTLKKLNVPGPSKTSKSNNFQEYDEEDPLADLLSSSGETTPRKRKPNLPPRRTESSDTEKFHSKKVISSLFGLDEPEQDESRAPERSQDPSDWLGLKGESELVEGHTSKSRRGSTDALKAPTTPKKAEKSTSEINTTNTNVDVSTDGQNKASTSSKKSHSVLDELLGRTAISSPKSFSTLQSDLKKRDSINFVAMSDLDTKASVPIGGKTVSNEGHTGAGAGKLGYTPSAAKQEPRPRRSQARKANLSDLPDPLGLFAPSKSNKEGADSEPQNASTSNPKPDSSNTVSSTASYKQDDAKIPWLNVLPPQHSESIPESTLLIEKKQALHSTQEPVTGAEIPMGETEVLKSLSNLELQVGEAAAQQQKSLISALALKRQEDLLLQLQTQHTALLKQHEQQLSALVQRQFQRQKQMIQQQELIQAHIEALMVQPPPIVPITLPTTLFTTAEKPAGCIEFASDPAKVTANEKERIDKILELKDVIEKLESENADLKLSLVSQRQRFEEQLKDMEIVYRKSLAVQDETIKKQEERLISERIEIEKDFTSRISRVKEEHLESSHQQAERMAELHSEWLGDLRRLGEFHRQAVDMLRSEQNTTFDHWKNMQITEMASIKEASVHSRLLQTAVSDLKESTSCLQQLREHLSKEIHAELESKRVDLHRQEEHLSGLREIMEKQATALEAEKCRINVLTQDLEARLITQRQDADDERQRLKEREKEWMKEKAGAIEFLEKEKQHLERLQNEARAELNHLEQQKIDLAREVTRLETTLHLQGINASRNNQQAEDMVAEARMTLHAAQEAGREMEREREDIVALKQELQAEKLRLSNVEKEIILKQAKLQKDTEQAIATRNEGVSALEEARRLERERSEHATDLAQRLLHLKERESHLAKEKLAVTIEWKRIQEQRESSTCVRCGQVASVSTLNTSQDIVDPVPIIMKLEAEQQAKDFATFNHSIYLPSMLESVSQ